MQQFDISPIPSTKETEQLFSGFVAQDKWMKEHSGNDWQKNTFAKVVESAVAEVSKNSSIHTILLTISVSASGAPHTAHCSRLRHLRPQHALSLQGCQARLLRHLLSTIALALLPPQALKPRNSDRSLVIRLAFIVQPLHARIQQQDQHQQHRPPRYSPKLLPIPLVLRVPDPQLHRPRLVQAQVHGQGRRRRWRKVLPVLVQR